MMEEGGGGRHVWIVTEAGWLGACGFLTILFTFVCVEVFLK